MSLSLKSYLKGNSNPSKHEGSDSIPNKSGKISIITDEPISDAPDFDAYSKTLSDIIRNSTPRFTIGIYGKWGTGKTTLMKMIQNHLDSNYEDDIVTIWFDAWRYEYEKYLAIIPLIRTIKIRIDNKIYRDMKNNKPITTGLKKLADGFTKILDGFSKSVSLNASLSGAGATLDIEKLTGILGSEGSVSLDGEQIYYRKDHITDYLDDYIKTFVQNVSARRLVIFIDDLDRCLPEKALELLESMKKFFDISGIIFVIGIDASAIDSIIKTKYGNGSEIDGMKYLQKFVQLPYTIPLWNTPSLSRAITDMVKKTQLDDEVIDAVLKPKILNLITRATELNPRDIKRFINSIVISQKIYGQSLSDIEKIIAIQAFYFHGEGWIRFLKSIISYKQRTKFLTHFILWLEKEQESQNISTLSDLNRVLQDDKKWNKDHYIYKALSQKSLKDIYDELINIGDNTLFEFIKFSKESLLKIDQIERYLRVADQSGIESKSEALDIDAKRQLELIHQNRIEEFNALVAEGIPIHLPFEDLNGKQLTQFQLLDSLLFGANLSGANLSGADMKHANLSKTDLSEADLSGADLTGANLSEANLSEANLSEAKLYKANLSGANLTDVDLSDAKLVGADLSGAAFKRYLEDQVSPFMFMISLNPAVTEEVFTNGSLSGANLSSADLSNVFLIKADLSGADLSGAKLVKANLSGSSLVGADLSNSNLSEANLSMAILSKAKLINVNLSKARMGMAFFDKSVIINNIGYKGLDIWDADFLGATIDDPDFLKLLHGKGCRSIPIRIQNKPELRKSLEEKQIDGYLVEYYLSVSQLPE